MDYATTQAYKDVNFRRSLGLTDEDIAYSMKTPVHIIRAVPLPRPQPQRQRSVQHIQLMNMATALMPAVETGDRDAITLMLKVMQREANLLGLDAPKEVISHNFNADLNVEGLTIDQLREIPTEQLKAMMLRELSQEAVEAELIPVETIPVPQE